jgi:hypothetical protein
MPESKSLKQELSIEEFENRITKFIIVNIFLSKISKINRLVS